MGCKVSCRRSTLQRHLSEECIFARQIKDMDVANTHDNFKPDDYEVCHPFLEICFFSSICNVSRCILKFWDFSSQIICPNAFMGCTYTCNRKNVHDHLLSCSFTGISKEQDLEERQLTKQAVIQKCEDERDRRQKHLSKGSGYWSDHSDLSETSRIRSHRSSKNKDDHNPTSEEPFNSLHQKKQKDVLKCHSPASSPVFSRARRAAGDRRPPNLASHCHLSNSQSLHHLLRSQVQSVVAR